MKKEGEVPAAPALDPSLDPGSNGVNGVNGVPPPYVVVVGDSKLAGPAGDAAQTGGSNGTPATIAMDLEEEEGGDVVDSLPSSGAPSPGRARQRTASEPTQHLGNGLRKRGSGLRGEHLSLPELAPQDKTFFRAMHRKRRQCEEEIASLEQQLAELDTRLEDERRKRGLLEKERDVAVIEAKARKKFNDSPGKGIRWLKEEADYFAAGGTTQEVATFLFRQEGLTKTAIGEYLGEFKPFNLAVMEAFVLLHDFVGMEFDAALRQYLWSFRLPGESQKIDRMMESFAKRFCDCNRAAFNHTDACYILAFSVIMLNTSLHNPAVAFKPTIEAFIDMNRGIDDGADIQEQMLRDIYTSISETPFKIPEDEAGSSIQFFNPEREGWLFKEGGATKTWKKRWVVLSANCLYYSKKQGDPPLGIIPLEDLRVRQAFASQSSSLFGRRQRKTSHATTEFFFELLGKEGEHGEVMIIKGCKTNSKGVVVQGNHRRYLFRSGTEEDVHEWIRCVEAAVQKNPFYGLYHRKKEQGGHSDSMSVAPDTPGGDQDSEPEP